MILVTGTSISVANSLTVTNSVTLSVLLSASCCARSCSVFCLWKSLFSLRYFAPLDLEALPWSFSKVSRTCFCTSSSVGSTFSTGRLVAGPPFRLLFLLLSLLNLLPPAVLLLALGRASLLSLLILLRRFFLSSVAFVALAPFLFGSSLVSFFFLGLLN